MSAKTRRNPSPSEPSPRTPPAGHRADWALGLGLAAVVIAANYRVAILGETYFIHDSLGFMAPALAFLGSALRHGHLPEWCDWVGIGVPFAANPIHGVTYPPFWIAAIIPPMVAKDVIVLLHLFVAGAGAAAFARRLGAGRWGAWLAGAVFVACGYTASMPGYNNVHLLCWTPWAAYAADRVARSRRRILDAALLAAVLGIQLIVGEPAHVATSFALAAIVLTLRADDRKSTLLTGAVSMAASTLLAAAALLPGLRVLGWTTRAHGLAVDERTAWSMSPVRIVEWIWPGLLGVQLPPGGPIENLARALGPVYGYQGATWAFSVYVGVPTLALVAWAAWRAREARWLVAASLGFVVLALGSATPVFGAVSWAVPALRIARYPEKYFVGSMVLWSAVAGIGFDRLVKRGADRVLVWTAVGGTLLLSTAVAAAWVWRSAIATALTARVDASTFPFDASAALRDVIASGRFAAVVAAAFCALVWMSARRQRAAIGLAAAAVLVGDLVVRSWSVNPTAARAALEPAPRLLRELPVPENAAARPRLWTHSTRRATPRDFESDAALAQYIYQGGLFENIPARFGLASVPGHRSLESDPLERIGSADGGVILLGVDYVEMADELLVAPDGTPLVRPDLVVTEDPQMRTSIVRVPSPTPRASVAPRWRRSTSPLETLLASRLGEDPGSVVVPAPGDPPPPAAEREPLTACGLRSPVPERVDLDCESHSGGYATLLDAAAPGWTAEIDGAPAPIEAADAVFRAVRIGPGRHHVSFRYETPWLRLGLEIAAVSWAAWLAVVVTVLRRRRDCLVRR